MLRSRLKNIINKSKTFSNKQEIGNMFDEFKKSLPIEVDDNYRLESAWKAYGSPKNYQEALWQGMIQPIDENTVKLPSIGYNELTDEYEYLNKGKENETVNKDIRVWDNDVIPLVKELKLGGFIRVYDEEKDCWKYSKNKSQETLTELGEIINSFLKGGKPKLDSKETGEEPIGYLNDGTPLYKKGDGTIGPLTKENIGKDNLFDLIKNSKANWAKRLQDPNRKHITYPDGSWGNFKLAWSEDETGTIVYPEILEIDGQLVDLSGDREKAWKSAIEHKDYIYFPSNEAAEWFTKNYKNYYKGFDRTPQAFQQGGKSKPKFEDWYKTVPKEKNDTTNYDLEKAYNELPFEELELFRTIPEKHLDGRFKKPSHMTYSDEGYGWIGSDKIGWTFYPSPRQLQLYPYEKYVEYWNRNEPNSVLNYNGKIYKVSPQAFKQGGLMNIIPEGALHARKNNMELAEKGEVTHKGIPVVDNEGELQAEIERNEIIFNKDLTNKIEDLYKKYNDEESSSKKDDIAIKMGKILTKEIIENTQDNTGLILQITQGNV